VPHSKSFTRQNSHTTVVPFPDEIFNVEFLRQNFVARINSDSGDCNQGRIRNFGGLYGGIKVTAVGDLIAVLYSRLCISVTESGSLSYARRLPKNVAEIIRHQTNRCCDLTLQLSQLTLGVIRLGIMSCAL
jgi:hypothetical protein